MDAITKSKTREIIDDFANEINERKDIGPKPTTDVIFFRSEHIDNRERPVYKVPIELLRYRKDNGRISSDVESYEKLVEPLQERSEKAQKIIREFLTNKDPEKTNELVNSIRHSTQQKPAIITCDGFLINGNRRKLAIERLHDETKDDKYRWMKVVILPGKKDPGGPPTLYEIEEVENRYQLQSEGKAEYYNFDRAISMRRKVNLGMSLDAQLRDDPNYAKLPVSEFKKVVRKHEEEFIEPLNCIDNYLMHFGREGIYSTVSEGISDREGRWQAFLDYYKYVEKKLVDENKRIQDLKIKESEVGIVRDVAFKIIRKRDLSSEKSGLPKVHKLMRDFSKYLSNPESKRALFELKNIDGKLTKEECVRDGKEVDERQKDLIWGAKNATTIIRQVKKAKQVIDYINEREEPISLLEAALDKLQHENLQPENIRLEDISRALKLAQEIKEFAHGLESDFWHIEQDNKKKIKELKGKHSSEE